MAVTAAENSIETSAETPVPAAARRADHGWVWQVTALSIGLGMMLALAVRTTSHIRKAGLPTNRLGASPAVLAAYKDQNERLQHEIERLRREVKEFEDSANQGKTSAQTLKEQLQDLKAMAGLAAVTGPGLKITLQDSTAKRLPNLPPEEYASYLVHDVDINGVLNELKAAGVEALAISGADAHNLQRIVVTSTARCVGPNTIVNSVQLSAPYTILAVGNPKELNAALKLPNGFVQVRGLDVLKMITVEESDHLVLPEYSGSFHPKYARPATPNS